MNNKWITFKVYSIKGPFGQNSGLDHFNENRTLTILIPSRRASLMFVPPLASKFSMKSIARSIFSGEAFKTSPYSFQTWTLSAKLMMVSKSVSIISLKIVFIAVCVWTSFFPCMLLSKIGKISLLRCLCEFESHSSCQKMNEKTVSWLFPHLPQISSGM